MSGADAVTAPNHDGHSWGTNAHMIFKGRDLEVCVQMFAVLNQKLSATIREKDAELERFYSVEGLEDALDTIDVQKDKIECLRSAKNGLKDKAVRLRRNKERLKDDLAQIEEKLHDAKHDKKTYKSWYQEATAKCDDLEEELAQSKETLAESVENYLESKDSRLLDDDGGSPESDPGPRKRGRFEI